MEILNPAFLPFAALAAFMGASYGRQWAVWAAVGVLLGPFAVFLLLMMGARLRANGRE